MVPVEAVIFDIGGVLEVTPRTGWEERWCARLGLRREDWEARLGPVWLAGSTGAMTLDQVKRATAAALRLDDAAVRCFMDDLWTEYLGELNQPLAEYFARLRPRYRTGILSNSFVGAREREQARYGLEDLCDVVVYSHEEGLLKPEPRCYRIVCERLGVDPASCVFVDDTEGHVEAAMAVGMQAITFRDNEQVLRALDRLLHAQRARHIGLERPAANS